MGGSQRLRIESAFDEAVAGLEKSARRFLSRYRLPREDAEDILQQAMLVYLIKHDEIYHPEAWLRGTLRRRCHLYWLRRQRTLLRLVDSSILDALAAPAAPGHGAAARDVRRDLGRALASIPPRCRRLLELRYGDDCDPQEAAARLGYQPSGAYKILERCLAALTRGLVATGFMKAPICEES